MKENGIEYYHDCANQIMALVIRSSFRKPGISFLTNDEQYQQVAYMEHPEGHLIRRHFHNRITRTIDYTCETLVIRKGVLAVELYEEENVVHSLELKDGDIISMFSGGHGFKAIQDVEMIEIKQGPFIGAKDKTRF